MDTHPAAFDATFDQLAAHADDVVALADAFEASLGRRRTEPLTDAVAGRLLGQLEALHDAGCPTWPVTSGLTAAADYNGEVLLHLPACVPGTSTEATPAQLQLRPHSCLGVIPARWKSVVHIIHDGVRLLHQAALVAAAEPDADDPWAGFRFAHACDLAFDRPFDGRPAALARATLHRRGDWLVRQTAAGRPATFAAVAALLRTPPMTARPEQLRDDRPGWSARWRHIRDAYWRSMCNSEAHPVQVAAVARELGSGHTRADVDACVAEVRRAALARDMSGPDTLVHVNRMQYTSTRAAVEVLAAISPGATGAHAAYLTVPKPLAAMFGDAATAVATAADGQVDQDLIDVALRLGGDLDGPGGPAHRWLSALQAASAALDRPPLRPLLR